MFDDVNNYYYFFITPPHQHTQDKNTIGTRAKIIIDDIAMDGPNNTDNNRTDKTRRRRRNKSNKYEQQRFANYLVFGFQSTLCLALFTVCYVLILVILWPLLQASTPTSMPDETPRDYIHHMHVPPSLKQIAHVPGQKKIKEVTSNLRKKLVQFRQGRGVTDENLLDLAVAEFEVIEKEKEAKEKAQQAEAIQRLDAAAVANQNLPVVAGNHHNGFIVLGMHRSGTSMLAGLLHESAGYKVGGPLIGSAPDNEKGFYERVDVVLQNDEFMKGQSIWWAGKYGSYDWELALKDKESGKVPFKEGERALKFLNNPTNSPWMQKDPRMCITLKTWLKLINSEPAIVFTYRHPLEVALSINKRDDTIPLEAGFRMWIIYNMRAIQNSQGLCMVRSSNDAILEDPLHEVQRISDELTKTCGVPAPPQRITQEEIEKLIDPKLQHNKKKRADEEKEVIKAFNNGKCIVYGYDSKHNKDSPAYKLEYDMYLKAMEVYCDFQSGAAYKDDYVWKGL